MTRSLILLLVALSALLALSSPACAAPPPPPRASLPEVENEVMCVLCRVPLSIADAPEADAERRFIAGLIRQGKTKAEIKQALVGQYGPEVLAVPHASGFNLTVYLVPLLSVLGGLLVLALLWPRWRRRARRESASARTGSAAPALAPSDTRRLDDELARFEP